MSIITISRNSYSPGKEIGEKVAQKLGYECITSDVLLEVSEESHTPEMRLLRAIRDAPSMVEHITFGKEKHVAHIRAALLSHWQRDNVVYHGLAGHYFVEGVSHVLKVRVIGNTEDRMKLVMRQRKVHEQAALAMKGISTLGLKHPGRQREISEAKALRILKHSDEARRKWGLELFGIDTTDPSIYDLVIDIEKLSVDDAVDIICHVVGLNCFQATAESHQALDDLALAARVKANLIGRNPRVNVTASKGSVHIGLVGTSASEVRAIQVAVEQIPGVEKIDINVDPFMMPD